MNGDPARLPSSELVPGRIKPVAVAAIAVVVCAGAVRGQPSVSAAAAAAVVAAAIAVEGHGLSSDIGWFATCLVAGWLIIVVGPRDGLIYWAAAMLLFGAEWLWVRSDPGWAAWLAGVTFTVVCALLVRHEIDLVAQLRAAQAGLAEQAATAERNRIARELHDVIGHTLVVSLLHVQSARLAVEHDPADAARALAEAERLGQECLAEVRTTVGLLREDDSLRPGEASGAMAPMPGAGGLPALVDRFRSAGADVTLTVEGDPAALPATTGLAVYRIAQEALTNAAKHAPGAATALRLAVADAEVTLTADSRPGPGGLGRRGSGLGVSSMRERAESLGGTCQAGPGGSGWLVRATLPLGARR